MIPDEVVDDLNESIENYASRLNNMTIREILNSDYEEPSGEGGEDWLTLMPEAKEYINFWKDAMREWRQAYGDMAGWREFKIYWQQTREAGSYDWTRDASAREVFLGFKFKSVRDQFGYASDEELYEMTPAQIATQGMAADRSTSGTQRSAEEREWSKAWDQVYEND